MNPFLCKQCGKVFAAKNRNGVPKEFCSRTCKQAWHNARRQRLFSQDRQKKVRQKGPSKRAEKVSRVVFVSLVPVEQRADLLREAAQNLGITDVNEIVRAIGRNGCAAQARQAEL